MVKTFDLTIYMKDNTKSYHNISRTAIKYYIDWYKESEDFYGYDCDLFSSNSKHSS